MPVCSASSGRTSGPWRPVNGSFLVTIYLPQQSAKLWVAAPVWRRSCCRVGTVASTLLPRVLTCTRMFRAGWLIFPTVDVLHGYCTPGERSCFAVAFFRPMITSTDTPEQASMLSSPHCTAVMTLVGWCPCGAEGSHRRTGRRRIKEYPGTPVRFLTKGNSASHVFCHPSVEYESGTILSYRVVSNPPADRCQCRPRPPMEHRRVPELSGDETISAMRLAVGGRVHSTIEATPIVGPPGWLGRERRKIVPPYSSTQTFPTSIGVSSGMHVQPSPVPLLFLAADCLRLAVLVPVGLVEQQCCRLNERRPATGLGAKRHYPAYRLGSSARGALQRRRGRGCMLSVTR